METKRVMKMEILTNNKTITHLKEEANIFLARQDIDIISVHPQGGLVFILYYPKD
jgi:hypothetical protein